jgi:phosphatidylinositol glycan class B
MSSRKASSEKALGTSDKTGAETRNPPDKGVAALIAEQARETLAIIFAVRFVNALTVRTFFQPDEYFQALEPAWQILYGDNSGAWITWVRNITLTAPRMTSWQQETR